MSKTKIYLVHGYTASKSSNWFPSFKKDLQNENVEVIVFDMPNSSAPDFNEWIEHLEKSIISYDDNSIFVGHSLGCTTLLSYLDKNRIAKSIKGIYLISGFIEESPIPELLEFVKHKLDYSFLINLTKKRLAISAKDDDIVPFFYTEKMAVKLMADFLLLEEGKHFIDRDNFIEFPILVDEIKKLLD